MKRALSISVLLLSLCVLLTACGKVRNAEKLIDDIGEVSVDSGPQIEAAERAIAELDADQQAKIKNLDLLEEAKLQYADALEIKKENDEKKNVLKTEFKILER